ERWAGTARLLRPLGLGGASGVSRGLAPVAGGRRRVERWQDGRRREIRPGGGSLDRQRRGSAVAWRRPRRREGRERGAAGLDLLGVEGRRFERFVGLLANGGRRRRDRDGAGGQPPPDD